MKLNRFLRVLPLLAGSGALIALSCGGEAQPAATPQVIIQTVVVEKQVTVEKIVEKPVEKIVEKIVEKQVEKVTVVTATPVQPATPTPVPAAKPAPASKQKAGEIVWAISSAGSGAGYNAKGLCCGSNYLSISETLFKNTKQNDIAPYLALSWVLASDAKSVTVKLRQGVQFHKGFGEMTADDVVWSYNDTNPSTSVKYGTGIPSLTDSGGSWTALLGANPLEKIDPYTVKITFANFDPLWPIWHFGRDGLAAATVSKKAYDQKGQEWNTDNMVATGVYELTTFVRGDRVVVEAFAQHWRQVPPQVKKITQITVPDETVRQAMLLTGEADIADVSLGNIPAQQRNGMTAVSNGNANIYSVWFTGNLWEPTHPTTGAKVEIGTYVADQPWIGNPYTPNDANNPPGIDDMEQARLVRQGLSLALDRDLINQKVVSGLGWAAYLPYFDTHANEWNDKWKVTYDPKKAGELLDKAGFPKKADGTRFAMPLYGFEYARGTVTGVADAVAGMWVDIGVKVDVLHFDYTIFRPQLVGKTAVTPYMDWDATGTYTNHPWDWPRGNQLSALSRGGKSHSLELPQATAALLDAGKEPDREKRIAINNKFADFLYDYQVGISTIATVTFFAVNPNKIASWNMEPGIRRFFNTPENIVLK